MECGYTCLNHNLLMSKKKVVTMGVIIKIIYYNKKTFLNVCEKTPKNIISPKLSVG